MPEQNGKSARRERIKQTAQLAAQRAAKNDVSTMQIIDVQHPMMIGASGKEINVFDVYDGMARVLFLVEHLDDEAKIAQGREAIIHTLRWNCDPFGAHSIAVDGVSATRGLELAAVQYTQNEIKQHIEKERAAQNSVAVPDGMPPMPPIPIIPPAANTSDEKE